jgi:hypothetical protein
VGPEHDVPWAATGKGDSEAAVKLAEEKCKRIWAKWKEKKMI